MRSQLALDAEIIKIDIKDVIDYCRCPQYYKLKKNDPNNYNLKEAYDICLHKCFYAYLVGLQQDDIRNGIDTLKTRWGKEWIKQKKNSQIVCTPSSFKRDTYDAKRKAGIDAIFTFYDIMQKEAQFPIVINRQYEIPITSKIALVGTWEYIREIERNGDSVIQILKFKTESNKFRTNHQINHDLELTAAALAFQTMFSPSKFELAYVDIYTKKMLVSHRSQEDFDLLKHTVISVVKSMRNDIQCIAPGPICYHCEYRNVCSEQL